MIFFDKISILEIFHYFAFFPYRDINRQQSSRTFECISLNCNENALLNIENEFVPSNGHVSNFHLISTHFMLRCKNNGFHVRKLLNECLKMKQIQMNKKKNEQAKTTK